MGWLSKIKEKIFGKPKLFLFEVHREDGSIDYYYVRKRKRRNKMTQKEAWKIWKEIEKQNEEEGKKYPKAVKIKPKFVKAFVD